MMNFVTRLTILVLLHEVASQSSVDPCAVDNGATTCVIIKNCDLALKLIKTLSLGYDNNNTYTLLRKMHCGFERGEPKVCCPIVPTSNVGSILYNKSEETATNRPKVSPAVRPTAAVITEIPTKRPTSVDDEFPERRVVINTSPTNAGGLQYEKPEETATKQTEPFPTSIIDLVQKTIPTLRTTEAAFITEIPVETEPPAILADPFPDRKICGLSGGGDRIYGGTILEPEEFPWLALVKYIDDKNNTRTSCSASLITNRHLVTAAHCFSSSTVKAVSVRLGEWNIENPKECYEGVCIDPPVEVEIETVHLYPGYSKKEMTSKDIAIIKLKQPVEFTDFIQPICLPTTEYVKMQDYTRDSSYYTAGWGITEYGEQSAIKRKVDLDAVPMDVCRAAIPFIPASSSQVLICAGGRMDKDSCRGDSGGPLMRLVAENYMINWYLFGITSFGGKQCGLAGIPGAYTRVTVYMDWIRAIVQT